MSNLVILESPSKAKTVKKYLGAGYDVIASTGHIIDLPKSKLGVDVDNNFTPQYVNMKDKSDVIKELKKHAKTSDTIYLATDPDREGEAIAWHLSHLLNISENAPVRVTFNEITKSGVQYGMSHPRTINTNVVDAQQARRVLDRIVGYKLSPFLWKKVRRGLSAGRVQSVAVRIIVDRENEIRDFKTQEYWSIDAKLTAASSKKAFAAKLTEVDGQKAEIADKAQADGILKRLEGAEYVVTALKKSQRKKQPAPPFTTSTLQQEASRRLSFQARRTMKAAQELYEGVDVEGVGAVGLITYMRTDSLRISDEAKTAAATLIKELYGAEYLPETPRTYKSKNNAQDAHEAIRPTDVTLTPEKVKGSLSGDQYKLYRLIWERFMASQMQNAVMDTVSADIMAADCLFKASGYSVKFDGFTKLYEESREGDDTQSGMLPKLEKGEKLTPNEVLGHQHFTQPPARYNEASLIKTLEENGIGRPSTYAPTISTILDRHYVERETGNQLKPTALGEVITELLKDHFNNIVDVKFTAKMESDLDDIENGARNWVDTMRKFYGGFAKTLEKAEQDMEGKRVKVPDEQTDIVCEECGKPMVIKIGPYGKFLGCSGFPDCKFTKKIVVETKGSCPRCGKKMLAKKSKKGKPFYGCEDYKNCNFMTWDLPIDEKCPECGAAMFKKTGKQGKIYCAKEGCTYQRPLEGKESKTDEG
ncbi:MAG: type I DNA topoisomerase [Oscillospiraceae bacterium]|nr:type I DNA topoisomerase [Oscillospiraceae bacterium]